MTSYHETDATFDQWRELRLLPAKDEWEKLTEKKTGVKILWTYPFFPKNLTWVIERAVERAKLVYADEFSEETFRAILNGEPRYHLAVEVVARLHFEIMTDPASIMPQSPPPEDRNGLRAWLQDFSTARWWYVALMLEKPGDDQKAVAESTFGSWLSGKAMRDKPFSLVLERARFWFDYMHCICDIHQAVVARIRTLRYGDNLGAYACQGVQTELKRFAVSGVTEEAVALEHRRLWDIAMTDQRLPDFQNMRLVTSNKHTSNPERVNDLWAKYFENDRKFALVHEEPEWVGETWETSNDTRLWPVAEGDNPLRYSYRREVKVKSRVRVASNGEKEALDGRIVQFKTLIKDDEGPHRRLVDGVEVYYREVWEDCPESMDSFEKLWDPLELLLTRRRHSKADWHSDLSVPPIQGVQ